MTKTAINLPGKVTIRPATSNDISVIAAIYRHYVTHSYASFELSPPSDAEMLSRWQNLTDQGYPWLVATHHDQLVGYAYASAFRRRAGMRTSYENSIYLAQEAVGKGFGRLLLSELVTQCYQSGGHLMVAMIGGTDNQASIQLHKSVGYQIQTILPQAGQKFGKWVDVVMMTRTLAKPEDL